jgi:hypothetical protein
MTRKAGEHGVVMHKDEGAGNELADPNRLIEWDELCEYRIPQLCRGVERYVLITFVT